MRDNLKSALDKFARTVIQQSRSRLTKEKINSSSDLYKSLNYDLQVGQNSFSLSFEMEDYGQFQDLGVSGKKRKYNTPFRYTNKKPPANVFQKWAKSRRIKPRNKKTGKFITFESFGFITQRHIFNEGIRPKRFFSKSFEQQFQNIPDEIIEAFALDLDNLLEFTT